MTNEQEFRAGDRVSILATVVAAGAAGGYKVRVDGIHDRDSGGQFVYADRLTLVKRPKRTVTIELDEDEAFYLWREIDGISPSLRSRIFAAIEEID